MKKLFLALITLLLVACSSGPSNDSKAGKYTGVGNGFGGEITVEVTLDDAGKITKVDVLEHSESVGVIDEVEVALEEVVDRIVDKNSADVDITSGATSTSNGLMDAVADALSKAK